VGCEGWESESKARSAKLDFMMRYPNRTFVRQSHGKGSHYASRFTFQGGKHGTDRSQQEWPETARVLVALVENKPGVLSRVASLFRRRNFNIESLTVGHTDSQEISRMTIVVDATRTNAEMVEQNLLRCERDRRRGCDTPAGGVARPGPD